MPEGRVKAIRAYADHAYMLPKDTALDIKCFLTISQIVIVIPDNVSAVRDQVRATSEREEQGKPHSGIQGRHRSEGQLDYWRPLTAISIRDKLNILSRASMFARVSPTAVGSEPSHLSAVMGP